MSGINEIGREMNIYNNEGEKSNINWENEMFGCNFVGDNSEGERKFFQQYIVLKGIKLQFPEIKELNVFLFEMSTRKLLLLLICRWERQEYNYWWICVQVINIHINLSLMYEKVTYQVININLRKAQTWKITKSATQI